MTQDRLWAPWRVGYITAKKKRKACIFCAGVRGGKGSHVIFKTKHSIAMLNIFPYNNGHLMVAPVRHVADLEQLKKTEVLDLFAAIVRAKKLLKKVLRPHGFNIGINGARCAGAGIVSHLHVHIVPRWDGDTNFMPALCATKVISQSLEELHARLKNAESKKD